MTLLEDPCDALVIGAGPAGLMAAEALAGAGRAVRVVDRMPSVGRKFLMAGKSGLNLTKNESEMDFRAAYGSPPPALAAALASFGPAQAMAWAEELGQPLFTGSSGRVFPKAMKASPLLRAWLARLTGAGVQFRTRWRWSGWDGDALRMETPEGPRVLRPRVTVLAMGGASWARLGSDGAWAAHLTPIAPFRPANCGFAVHWTDHMRPHFGSAVKATLLTAKDVTSRGEWVLTRRGVEGGGIYAVSAAVRDHGALTVDLLPDLAVADLAARLGRGRAGKSLGQVLKTVLRLPPVKVALFQEFAPGQRLSDPLTLARTLKSVPLRHTGPLPMDGAISTAGGVPFSALTDGLMLRDRAGVFCAGEMLDWDAPTGGYLLTACLATGLMAGRAAAVYAGPGKP